MLGNRFYGVFAFWCNVFYEQCWFWGDFDRLQSCLHYIEPSSLGWQQSFCYCCMEEWQKLCSILRTTDFIGFNVSTFFISLFPALNAVLCHGSASCFFEHYDLHGSGFNIWPKPFATSRTLYFEFQLLYFYQKSQTSCVVICGLALSLFLVVLSLLGMILVKSKARLFLSQLVTYFLFELCVQIQIFNVKRIYIERPNFYGRPCVLEHKMQCKFNAYIQIV